MSAADSEAQKARFSDFVTQHPVLAAGSAIAAGGLAAYVAESNGLSLPVAAGIGVAGATSAVLLSSLAYLERPAYVQDHPYIAGFQFVGVTGVSAFFIHDLTGGLIEVPLAALLGAPFGIGAIAITAAGYDWLKGIANALTKPLDEVKKTVNQVTTELGSEAGRAEVSNALTDMEGANAGSLILNVINYGPTTVAKDAAKSWGVLWDDSIKDADDIAFWTRNGNATQRAVAVRCLAAYQRVVDSQGRDDAANHELQARLDELRLVITKPDTTFEDADARFTTNMDNPPAPIEQQNPGKDYDEIIADERVLTGTYNEQHKEEVDAFVEEVHDMTVEEIQARAKAGPFAQGPKK